MNLNKEDIILKVKNGDVLSREEELLYLVEVLGFGQQDAERILYINENYTDERIVD